MSDVDFYKVLGISTSATKAEIKGAYKKLALRFHPDKNRNPGAEEKFKSIQRAYQILSDESQKVRYDLSRPYESPFDWQSPSWNDTRPPPRNEPRETRSSWNDYRDPRARPGHETRQPPPPREPRQPPPRTEPPPSWRYRRTSPPKNDPPPSYRSYRRTSPPRSEPRRPPPPRQTPPSWEEFTERFPRPPPRTEPPRQPPPTQAPRDFHTYFQQTAKKRELSELLSDLTRDYSRRVLEHNLKRDAYNRSKEEPSSDKTFSKARGAEYYALQAEFYENEVLFFLKEKVFNELQKEDGCRVEYYEKEIQVYEKKMEASQAQVEYYKKRATEYAEKVGDAGQDED